MIEFSADPSALVKLVIDKAKPDRELARRLAISQRDRILTRTKSGKDFEGRAFVEYSKNGPIYYYPAGRTGKRTNRSQRDAAARAFKSITGKPARFHLGRKKALSGPQGEAWLTPGGGLGFSSYHALKRWAGRRNVDLTGLKAPHMMQSMQVKFSASEGQAEGIIGIYGPKARLAREHNKGNPDRRLPKRKFLAASKADEQAMKAEVTVWLRGRIGLK